MTVTIMTSATVRRTRTGTARIFLRHDRFPLSSLLPSYSRAGACAMDPCCPICLASTCLRANRSVAINQFPCFHIYYIYYRNTRCLGVLQMEISSTADVVGAGGGYGGKSSLEKFEKRRSAEFLAITRMDWEERIPYDSGWDVSLVPLMVMSTGLKAGSSSLYHGTSSMCSQFCYDHRLVTRYP